MFSDLNGLAARGERNARREALARFTLRPWRTRWNSDRRRQRVSAPTLEGGAVAPAAGEPAFTVALRGLAGELEAAALHLRRAADAGSATGIESIEPSLGALSRWVAREASIASCRPLSPAAFARVGDVWTLSFEGRTARVPHLKGLEDLVALLARPDQEIHCIDLIGGTAAAGDALPALDERARDQYRARMRELRAAIDAAHADNDPGAAERAEAELAALVQQLSASFGLGGRARRSKSPAERARSAIGWRIRAAIKRIAEVHPELGRHLESSVRTGNHCIYRPAAPVSWRL